MIFFSVRTIQSINFTDMLDNPSHPFYLNNSIAGFDNIDRATHNDALLTTIDIPKRQLGAEAARRLLALLEDDDFAPTDLIIPVRLIERASTAPIQV